MNPRRRRLLREKMENDPSRREFLWKGACAALTATGIASTIWDLRGIKAAAADQAMANDPRVMADYKALVCIFLFGGNDGNNMLVPTDSLYTNNYLPARTTIAIPNDGSPTGLIPLTPLSNDGHTYGLHPKASALANLFNTGKCAILCNVGTLLAPLTRQQYLNHTVAVPPQLFSHSDQQIEWQTAIEDQAPRTGWGGRIADMLYGVNTNNNVSMNISLAGSNTFEVGDVINEYNVSTSGAVSLNISTSGQGPAQLRALKDLIAMNHANLYESAFATKMDNALANADALNAAIATTKEPADGGTWTWSTAFPGSTLGKQLKMIARLIEAAPDLGHNRQVFFASIGGFDLHATEGGNTGAQANLLQDVSNCMNALYQATLQIQAGNAGQGVPPREGLAAQVVQFTASDFNRTFPANGDAGTDHAWGNHQIIVGDGVVGQRLYGTYPVLTVGGQDDTSTGRWIPTTAVEQYSATLAKWFGVSPANMTTIFPYLGRFATADLGFMG
jgi:uncharacterized protein (DUF1501 family)